MNVFFFSSVKQLSCGVLLKVTFVWWSCFWKEAPTSASIADSYLPYGDKIIYIHTYIHTLDAYVLVFIPSPIQKKYWFKRTNPSPWFYYTYIHTYIHTFIHTYVHVKITTRFPLYIWIQHYVRTKFNIGKICWTCCFEFYMQKGRSALDLAKKWNHSEVIRLLEEWTRKVLLHTVSDDIILWFEEDFSEYIL